MQNCTDTGVFDGDFFFFRFLVLLLLRNLLNPRSQRFTFMFSSKDFVDSGLICKSLMQFEVLFVYGVRLGSDFIFFLQMDI